MVAQDHQASSVEVSNSRTNKLRWKGAAFCTVPKEAQSLRSRNKENLKEK